MCAALRRELHFEKELPSILEAVAHVQDERARRYGESYILKRAPPSNFEAVAHVQNECARRYGESYILKTSRPPSAKLLQIIKTNVRGARARATF